MKLESNISRASQHDNLSFLFLVEFYQFPNKPSEWILAYTPKNGLIKNLFMKT